MPRTGVLAGPDSSRGVWNNAEVGPPHPLAAGDAARIRAIFAWQQPGLPASRLDEAVRATRDLHDATLLGDILADRYLSPGARPDPHALQQWLRRWPDLSDAGAIRRRLSDLAHGRVALPPVVAEPVLDADPPSASPPEEADPAERAFRRNPLLDRTIRSRLEQGEPGARSALRLVMATRFPDPLYAAMLRAEIAQRLFTGGNDAEALRVARSSMAQAGGRIGLAAYVGGLAAWRQGEFRLAQSLFEQGSRSSLTAASTRAASAFWAARAHRRLHDEAGWRSWMQRAAAASDTFYGMLAARMLDASASPVIAVADVGAIAPGAPVLGEADVEAVAATAEGRRAFALLQVGQPQRAEAALRMLWPRVARSDAALCRSIELVAGAAGMTGLSAQLATILQSRDGRPRDAARFPMPRLHPAQGFTVNPALVYALTRLESNFDNRAVSGAGAHGLMQIMPVTANFMLGEPHRFRGRAPGLHNPGVNLEVGQRYLTYLSGQDGIDGNLIRLLASYNAGPNAVAGWSKRPEGDPLLFIETLPVRETRDFVHRALSYLWIYAARMDLPAPSLDTLAGGGWPRFDDEQRMASARPDGLRASR